MEGLDSPQAFRGKGSVQRRRPSDNFPNAATCNYLQAGNPLCTRCHHDDVDEEADTDDELDFTGFFFKRRTRPIQFVGLRCWPLRNGLLGYVVL